MNQFHALLIRLAMNQAKRMCSGLSFALLILVLAGANSAWAQSLTQNGFTSVLTPQFMSSGGSTRLPVMYRATVTDLTPNTVYRFYTQGATNSTAGGGTVDFGTTNPGAGNPLLISPDGTTYSYTTGPSLSSAGNYQSFTTDASGNYTGWFGFVNTANARFTAGNQVYPTIVIGNTSGTVLNRRALNVAITVLGYAGTAGANNGSFLKETGSSASAKNLVALYDNTTGTGRPLYIAPVESIGTTIASVTPGYATTAGSWNAIIPNNNANGVRRIEQRSVTTNAITGCATDEDGVWPTGNVNTANPANGTTAATIAAADASLATCVVCSPITVSALAGVLECPSDQTTVQVSASGGVAPYTGTGSFMVGAGAFTYTVTDANGCTGSTSISLSASDTLKPVLYLQTAGLSAGVTGPSSSQTPYLVPTAPGVKYTSILSVNDVVAGYRMAGLADGLGAFDNGDGTFTLLVNHEIPNTLGVTRAHGSKGAFVSKWIIRKSDLTVLSGGDLMQTLHLWNTATSTYSVGTLALSRFCSADLAAVSAYYNKATGLGTPERIFLNGEESGLEGKALGHIVTGTEAGHSYELPYLGKFAWENAVASPYSGNKTVVGGMDDGTGGQVYMYVGTKANTGNTIEKAGLTGGKLYGIRVVGLPVELQTGVPAPGTRFEMFDHGTVQNTTGDALNTASVAAGVTTFQRPEDGAWDPAHPNDFYFATTNAFANPTRLWRLRFDNILTPEAGGTIEAVIDGTEGARMLDNIGIDKKGHILLVEDVGNNAHLGKVWQYNIDTDSFFVVGSHDSTRFRIGGANFLTQDEEASGIIDASEILGPGMALVDDQAHFAPAENTAEVVEGGQLLAVFNPYLLDPGTAKDTVRAQVLDSAATATVNLGIPASGDNCTIVSLTNNAPATFPVGTTIVTWTATDASGNTGTINQVVVVTITPNVNPTVTIAQPVSGSRFAANRTVTIKAAAADSDGTVVKVEFYVGAVKIAVDSTAPYEVEVNSSEAGVYKLNARVYDNRGGSGKSDTSLITTTACQGAGYIVGEGYLEIPGGSVANLTSSAKYPDQPDVTAQLSSLEFGPNIGDQYGARVRGYICAPISGNYTFAVASDDQSELWLSTNEDPANKRRIAFNNSPVSFRSYLTFGTQKSDSIFLLKGAKYYIEVLHKEDAGSDHLSVGWQLPGGTTEAPIAGSRLSPFESAGARVAAGSFESAMRKEEDGIAVKGLTVIATPNPSTDQFTIVTRSNESTTVTLIVTDALGRVIEKRSSVPANGTLYVGNKLGAGIYFVEVVQGTQKKKLKLVKQ